MKFTLLVFCLSLFVSVIAAEEKITLDDQIKIKTPQINSRGPEKLADEVSIEMKESSTRGEKLKQEDLGEISQNFVPSELISTDNAVPFPVDI
ncbi:MAG: hypothetical protein ACJ0Q6_08145 [Candidatus Azotimanducaceae bacterium]|uniref:Uncharacterized protein n=1 Tax=OM182 bacterium TaxID=2510334 RepID=A0A520S479_9GAMM|nr:hypothetical protein [Gammaproteobacteria bacterium]OUV68215.1 MAG: hypothetical protein CBC93_02490 [Gammaproteobacteria bacterium TMED133]RZO77295.1 MAG: hypothetical protein EVA68_01525 [OM182 bacterium]